MIGGMCGDDDDDDKMCMDNDLGWRATDDDRIIWHCRRSELDDMSGMMNGNCSSTRNVYSYPTDLSSAVIPLLSPIENAYPPLTYRPKTHNLTISTPLSQLPKPPLPTPPTPPPSAPVQPPQPHPSPHPLQIIPLLNPPPSPHPHHIRQLRPLLQRLPPFPLPSQ